MKGYGQKRYLQEMICLVERNDPSTTNVVLNGFQITDAKLAGLAMALVNNTHVARLHLDGNAISDRGAGLLAYALKQNRTLELVSLNDNDIRSAGANAIAAALHGNGSLRTLRLANNAVGSSGARSLRRMMEGNASVRELVLDGNAVGPRAAGRFDERCRIRIAAEPAAYDSTADSTYAGSDFTRCTSSGTDEEEGEADDKSGLEWAASSAMSLFGASRYMENDVALKYIIGEDSGDVDLNTSWNNLASYMVTVQRAFERPENKEENNSDENKFVEDDDELSVVFESNDVSQLGPKQKKKRKKWFLFKKTQTSKEIHSRKEP